ncbi:MT-A70 family methyltransferase [Phreatobacter sp.]|uniref:MT-A70 family methyltransferase n=1 Tax=Phreatobacter sp. TaxID=1966341 RepID=UPI003F7306C3
MTVVPFRPRLTLLPGGRTHPATGLGCGAFDLVVADPPWPFAVRGANGHGKSPEAHYATMEMDAIARLSLGGLVAPGGVMILWGTFPLLQPQMALLGIWGLTYVTGGVWAKRTVTGKLRWGPGYWTRTLCEPWLIATRPGVRPWRWNGRRFPNWTADLCEQLSEASLDGLAREHSRKPDAFYRLVEAASPGARRADLFAREHRPGWTGWGRELGRFSDSVVPMGRMEGWE